VSARSGALRRRLALYAELIRLRRPAGWLVLLWPTLVALWLAAGGFPGWHLLAVFVFGTVLTRSAGCCVNDMADREFDRHVKRTAQRPVTTGHISAREAAGVACVLALAALALVLTTRWQAVAWSALAVLCALLYPFTKRFFAVPQVFLALAFNFGILIAFAAVQGTVPAAAWVLWLANLCMVLAYDTEYAMVDRDDDVKIGLHTSAIAFGRWDVAAVMACYAASLLLAALALAARVPGWAVCLGLAAAAAQLPWHYARIRQRSREGCFAAFSQSHWIGACIFFGVALGFAFA